MSETTRPTIPRDVIERTDALRNQTVALRAALAPILAGVEGVDSELEMLTRPCPDPALLDAIGYSGLGVVVEELGAMADDIRRLCG